MLPPEISGCFNILFQTPFKASFSQKRSAHRPISPLRAFMDQTPKRAVFMKYTYRSVYKQELSQNILISGVEFPAEM
jgi:hypothetical protein